MISLDSSSAAALRAPLDPTAHVGALQEVDDAVSRLLRSALAVPAMELMLRPSRQFRGNLVHLGFSLVTGRRPTSQETADLDLCARSIEVLHLGSLIVDDVQDGSRVRRGGAALHETLGVPRAVAVGNWLYFHAANLLAGVGGLAPSEVTALTKLYHQAVELAHLGQALDLGVPMHQVDAHDWESVCMTCGRLKTGSIIMLALRMGSAIGRGNAAQSEALGEIGFALGLFLQRLNDLGGFLGTFDADKRLEDVVAAKPSFVWVFIQRNYGPASSASLQAALKDLPDEAALRSWFERHSLRNEALTFADQDFCKTLARYSAHAVLCPQATARLTDLKEQIIHAYLP